MVQSHRIGVVVIYAHEIGLVKILIGGREGNMKQKFALENISQICLNFSTRSLVN